MREKEPENEAERQTVFQVQTSLQRDTDAEEKKGSGSERAVTS